MRRIDEIIIHCSATPEGREYHARDIDRWHKQRGWKKIGYHYIVCLDGSYERGREDAEVGAHCTGHNSYSIGVCYIGGLAKDGITAKDTRTDAQKKALLTILRTLRFRYPSARIRGHRDFAAKACPSFNATEEYRNI